MPATFSRKSSNLASSHYHGEFTSIARHLATLCAVLAAVVFLCGCPKKQWSYTPPPAPAPSKDFDAHFDPAHPDPNGAPRNVDWRPQIQGRIPNPDSCNDGQPYSTACTQDKPFQDQPDGLREAFCFIGKAVSGSPIQPFYGHADWMVAQFDGSIGWFNFGDDFDYDLLLVPGSLPQGAGNEHGITTNNNHVADNSSQPQYIEVEWDSAETDAAFPDPGNPGTLPSWWAQFKQAGHADDTQQLARLLHPSDEHTLACGSVVGLFGLDCDHGCRSELHPLYGLAIQRTEDPADNEWSVLVRNWGTGGYCSQYNDELAETSLSIVLPYSSSQPPTKVEVQDFVTTTVSGPGVQCPKIYFQDGQTIVNLTLPPPENQGVAAFSLKLQWPAGAQPMACTQVKTAGAALAEPAAPAAHPAAPLKGEDYLGALLRGTKQGQRLDLEKDILPTVPREQTMATRRMTVSPPPQSCDGAIQVIPGRPPVVHAVAVRRLRKDPVKRSRDEALRTYICQQYRAKGVAPPVGTQQDLDQACKGVK